MGFAHPDHLLEQLTSEQLSEWQAYNRLEPINRDEFGWAMLCSVVSNLALSIYSKKGTHPKYTTPGDFIPKWDSPSGEKEKPVQSIEEQKGILLHLAGIQNRGKKNG